MKSILTPRSLPSALAVVFLGAWFTTCAALATTIPAPYELATWRGFRASAVSYTFDDNSPKQFSVAQPMLDAKGFDATFFCIVGNLSASQWATIESASAQGHEIGSHTLTHPDLTTLTDAQVIAEESGSKNLIESHTGKKCVSLAYPYCRVPNKSITAQYYPFARSCNGSLVPATPSDFLSIGALGPDAGMNDASDSAAGSGSWLVWLLHGIDDDAACCPIDSQMLQSNLDYVASAPDLWWVETFGNVCRYIQERNAAVLTVVSDGSTSITLRLTHDLDPTVFNYPLTLRRTLPSGWASATITQNGATVPSQIVNGKLVFDVVPNGGDIVLAQGGGIVANGTYKIVARHSGKALDVSGGATADGSNVVQWTYGGGSNQRWNLTHLGNNEYSIVGVQSGKALDVSGWGTSNGSNVHIWTYGGAANQKWTITATSGGYYRLTPTHATTMALDVNGVSSADGANLQIWTYGGGDNQQWAFQAP